MKKTLLAALLTVVFGTNPLWAGPQKEDLLRKVYRELKVGMSFSEVHNLVDKNLLGLKLKDTDIWMPDPSEQNRPFLSWVLGLDAKMISIMGRPDRVKMHRIVLRLDFDDRAKLLNAVYVRFGKKFEDGDSKEDERLALVGDGYYQ